MRFLVDAQLPWRLAAFLTSTGHHAIHTRRLPDGNRMTDGEIADLADRDGRVVITKDRDSGTVMCSAGLPGGCWSWRPATLILHGGPDPN